VEVVEHYSRTPTDVLLIDCRSPAEYAGRHSHPLDLGVEHHRVGGRIPGARNLPSTRLLTRGGSFRSLLELQDLFEASGVRDDVEVVVYGRAAPQSSLCWFGLHELLRHSRVRHYDGGWTEYGSLVDVPVERGD
jgi:thiosulfate/3-mercaptopyruvate sulfurtransferase